MQRAARCHGEGMEYVREHLRREITDLVALDAQVGHAIWARADVDNRARKSLVERSKARAVSADPLDFTQRLLERRSECNRRVLGCVVVVDPEVAFRLERERHAAVLREGVVHVIEETNPGRDVDGLLGRRAGLAVQIDGHFDDCLVGFARYCRGAGCHGRHFRDSLLTDVGGGTDGTRF